MGEEARQFGSVSGPISREQRLAAIALKLEEYDQIRQRWSRHPDDYHRGLAHALEIVINELSEQFDETLKIERRNWHG